MTDTTHTTLGDLVSSLYEEFLAIYGDEELAAVATASTIDELLTEGAIRRAEPRAREAGAA